MKLRFKTRAGIVALLLLGFVTLVVIGLIWTRRHAEPHSVTLSWQAPRAVSGVTIVGYNVYRRASEGESFVRIATDVSQPYEDRMVSSGRTYFYVVTSVDQAGRESRFSAAIKVEIP